MFAARQASAQHARQPRAPMLGRLTRNQEQKKTRANWGEVEKVVEPLLGVISEFTKSCRNRDFLREGYRLGEFKILKVPTGKT